MSEAFVNNLLSRGIFLLFDTISDFNNRWVRFSIKIQFCFLPSHASPDRCEVNRCVKSMSWSHMPLILYLSCFRKIYLLLSHNDRLFLSHKVVVGKQDLFVLETLK